MEHLDFDTAGRGAIASSITHYKRLLWNWESCAGYVHRLGISKGRQCFSLFYCVGQPWSISCNASCAAFMSPTRSGGGEPAFCI